MLLVILAPINTKFARLTGKYLQSAMARSDERVRLISEILRGIRVIKFYVWERPFTKRVLSVREQELMQIRKRAMLNAMSNSIMFIAPVAVAVLVRFWCLDLACFFLFPL